MEALTILLMPNKTIKKNPAVYFSITAYLYIASITLFKYLISCLPTKASYYTYIPQLALLTSFPLPLHEKLVRFPNADMTHYYSAFNEAFSNDRQRDPSGALQLRLAVLGRLLAPINYQQMPLGPLACLPLYVANMWVVNIAQCDRTAHMLLGLERAFFDPL